MQVRSGQARRVSTTRAHLAPNTTNPTVHPMPEGVRISEALPFGWLRLGDRQMDLRLSFPADCQWYRFERDATRPWISRKGPGHEHRQDAVRTTNVIICAGDPDRPETKLYMGLP